MRSRDLSSWMWSEALSLMERADRLHRQFFLVHEPASWEPPLDVVDSGDELRLQLALPGVAPDALSVTADDEGVSVHAVRGFPHRDGSMSIHRVEIPYGRFHRRIEFPAHLYQFVSRQHHDGILTLTFRRKEGA